MENSLSVPQCASSNGDMVPLEGVGIEAVLRDLLGEVAVTQTYRNKEQTNIEAVYTFPLPPHAVLLRLAVRIGDRELDGMVVERKKAEDQYEDAITDGDTAVLLEEDQPGMFTMNVGNLLPGEAMTVQFTYSFLCRWQCDSLRFHLPTTIAPRYGNPAAAGLQPHQEPAISLLHRNEYTLSIRIAGMLQDSLFECPTHRIKSRREENALVVLLAEKEPMDRDFILILTPEGTPQDSLVWEPEGDDSVLLATFRPRIPAATSPAPVNLKIVTDCSGSMGGDSIAQARNALHSIMESLQPDDSFTIIAFGNSQRVLFDTLTPAGKDHVRQAQQFIQSLDADLGGTEIGAALSAAYRILSPEGNHADILLITDGEVWNSDEIIREAKESGHRIFTVGVGSSVSEAFVRELAESTGGACELVSPREGMAEGIVRHFQRIHTPRSDDVSISWPGTPIEVFPEKINTVFDGDTVHVYAKLKGHPTGTATLKALMPDGVAIQQQTEARLLYGISERSEGILARMYASTCVPTMSNTKVAAELACRYRIISKYTSYIVVHLRAEDKAEGLPELRRVPNMLAAGWGGIGKTMIAFQSAPKPSDQIYFCLVSDYHRVSRNRDDYESVIYELNNLYDGLTVLSQQVSTLDDLENIDIPVGTRDVLRELVEQGANETDVVVLFLSLLARSGYGRKLTRTTRRAIRQAYQQLHGTEMLEKRMRQLIKIKKPLRIPLVTGVAERILHRAKS
ncbi:MAG: VIT and vWA domain-containing protein [Candidatus Latescibacterota bacterium]